MISRQGAGDLLEVLKPHPDVEPVKNRRRCDAGIGETMPETRTPGGERGQHRVLGAHNGVESAADQRFDSRIGFRDGPENLPATSLRFDIADPHLQMPLPILTAADEGRVQADHDRRRRRFRLDRGTLSKSRTGFQGLAAKGLRVLRGVQREYLRQQVSCCPIGQEGGKMRLKPTQFWCRPAMRWPVDTGLAPATRATAKAGKPYRDLAEQRGDHMVLIVFHTARAATPGAGGPPNGVIPDLCRDNLLLE